MKTADRKFFAASQKAEHCMSHILLPDKKTCYGYRHKGHQY